MQKTIGVIKAMSHCTLMSLVHPTVSPQRDNWIQYGIQDISCRCQEDTVLSPIKTFLVDLKKQHWTINIWTVQNSACKNTFEQVRAPAVRILLRRQTTGCEQTYASNIEINEYLFVHENSTFGLEGSNWARRFHWWQGSALSNDVNLWYKQNNKTNPRHKYLVADNLGTSTKETERNFPQQRYHIIAWDFTKWMKNNRNVRPMLIQPNISSDHVRKPSYSRITLALSYW